MINCKKIDFAKCGALFKFYVSKKFDIYNNIKKRGEN